MKIMFKQYLFLFLFVFIRVNISQEVVSTTQKSSNQLSNDQELTQINYRLLALELQNAQFQKSMEKQCKLDDEKLSNILATLENNITATCDTTLVNNEKQASTVNDSTACNSNLLNETAQIIAKIEKKQEELLTLFEGELQKTKEEIITKIENEQKNLLGQFEVKLQKMEERIAAKISKIVEDELEDRQVKQKEKLKGSTNNCLEYKKAGQTASGVYNLTAANGNLYSVYCDMDTKGGGWIQILNRFDGSENFDVNWNAYREGFGKSIGEFWLGLEHLHQLTHSEDYELLVNLIDWDNKKVYASYTKFEIGSENEGYSLKVIEGYSGDAGDGLSPLQGMRFSTKDKDNDSAPTTDCAKYYKGGWWFKTCYTDGSKLTGIYLKNTSTSFTTNGIHWLPLHYGSLKEAKMMIRPRKKV